MNSADTEDEYSRRRFLSLATKGVFVALVSGCAQTRYTPYYHPAAPAGGGPGGALSAPPAAGGKGQQVPTPAAPSAHAGKPAKPPSPDGAGRPAVPAGCVVHEVAPMETVPRLAETYGVSEEAICSANGINAKSALTPGRELLIPHPTRFKNMVPVFKKGKWKYIIVHHTAGEFGKALSIDQIHRERGFEEGLGYHFLIDNGTLGKGNGQLEVAPRWLKQEEGAHCKASGMNYVGIGIGLVGNFNNDRPSKAQLHTLTLLVSSLGKYYNIGLPNVFGHRQVPEARTDCPGIRFPWDAFRAGLAKAGLRTA